MRNPHPPPRLTTKFDSKYLISRMHNGSGYILGTEQVQNATSVKQPTFRDSALANWLDSDVPKKFNRLPWTNFFYYILAIDLYYFASISAYLSHFADFR